MDLDTRYFPIADSHRESHDLVGLRANFRYGSGNVLQQFYASETTMVWTGLEGDFVGVEQTEPTLRVFHLGGAQYLVTWYEPATVASAEHGEIFEGGYPITVVADFERGIATAAYTNPRDDGGQYFLIDQATIEILEEPNALSTALHRGSR